MASQQITISVPVTGKHDGPVEVVIATASKKALLTETSLLEAKEYGEATVQILEGCTYEYKVTDGYGLNGTHRTVQPSSFGHSSGKISPNIYVGTLTIDIILLNTKERVGEIQLEVRSVKADYRTDYRHMLEEITEHCTELIMQQHAPISQHFTIDFSKEAATLYQRFAFMKSIVDTEAFEDAIHKIVSAPVTNWMEAEVDRDIHNVKRINSKTLRQIANSPNRIKLSDQHYLKNILDSLPETVKVSYKKETVDTAENRFIKYALSHFLSFCSDFVNHLKEDTRLKKEAQLLEAKLSNFLSHAVFKNVSSLHTLPLNSPVLQRKSGYREVLRTWIMFDLAAKLTWKGGEDVYEGGKKDVAVLYEYWLFFKLANIISDVFKLKQFDIHQIIESTKDGLGLKLKQGEQLHIMGVFENKLRRLQVQFSYNRTFKGDNPYPYGGSWTTNLRPDFTLSIWPADISAEMAEMEELIVHIHFDAKYKIKDAQEIFAAETDLSEEKMEQRKGTYQRGDLLKMHTYRDAIRRTYGAYILYPGDNPMEKRGFYEILPGLGAFSIKPSKTNTSGVIALRAFLEKVAVHVLNRASQREQMAFGIYDIHKTNGGFTLNEPLPEASGVNRALLPNNTFVLIGYYKNEEHLRWILANNLYNTRIGTVSDKAAGAKYLLLYTGRDGIATRLYKMKNTTPAVLSRADLKKKGYPFRGEVASYLVFDIEQVVEREFEGLTWNVGILEGYPKKHGLPFVVSMREMMEVIFRDK